MKSLLFLFAALAVLAAVKTDFQEEMKVDAGSEVPIPCNLKGPKVTWFWVPHYPICAGLKGDKEEKAIYSVISSGIIETNERFQNRLIVENQKPDNSSILTLRFLYMNDSGVFYCSAGQAKSRQISVTVKPGSQNGITLDYEGEPEKGSQIITITCSMCKNEAQTNIYRDDTITTWTLNGKSVPQGLIRKTLRDSIKIKRHYKQYFGLWKCIRPSCLTQFDGYCLENDSETSRSDADMETTTVSVTDVTMMANPHVIGGSIAGLLILLLVFVIIFIICRRRHSHGVSPSGTTREPETQESKEPAGSEGSPQRRDGEEPRTEDHTSTEGAGEGIQYSTLEFKETGQHQIKIDNEASSVIYAQMPTTC